MDESRQLEGRCLLVVEDEYLVAADLAASLELLGAEVVGPAGSVEEALTLVENEGGRLDGAVLDINLRNERVYPVADVLAARGVPFVFTTGYDAAVVPRPYSDVPRCEKPVDRARLIRCLNKTQRAEHGANG
jgi:DNA-binding LytR/AlgR family response regulator